MAYTSPEAVKSMPGCRRLRVGKMAALMFAAVWSGLNMPAAAQFGAARPLYVGPRGTTALLPSRGPGPLDPLSVAAYWGFWPNPVLARQPIGHQTIATSANGYIYRPVYADDPTAASVAMPNLSENAGAAPLGRQPAGQASPEAPFEAALDLLKAGRYEATIDRLNQELNFQPDEGRAYLLMTQAFFGLGKYQAAVEALAAALARAPEYDWETYPRNYAKYFASSLRFAMHLRSLERFVELHPERVEGHLLLGYQYGSLGQIDRALAELDLAKPNLEADALSRHFAAAGEAPAPPDEIDAPKPEAAPKPPRRGRKF